MKKLSLYLPVLISFILTCVFINSCDYFFGGKVIEITSHEMNKLDEYSGAMGINLDLLIYPKKIETIKDRYILALFFFHEDKKQIKAEEVNEVLKKSYIKDLSYYSSSRGNLAHYREIKFDKSDTKIEQSFFIPYGVLPFYDEFLTKKIPHKFFVRVDLYYDNKREAKSDYYEISLDWESIEEL